MALKVHWDWAVGARGRNPGDLSLGLGPGWEEWQRNESNDRGRDRDGAGIDQPPPKAWLGMAKRPCREDQGQGGSWGGGAP